MQCPSRCREHVRGDQGLVGLDPGHVDERRHDRRDLRLAGGERPERVRRTIDGYLHYAQHHQAAYRTIVTDGVGFDIEVHAIRDGVREAILTAIAHGAWGRGEFPQVARMALSGWMSPVEGVTLDWLAHQELPRETVQALLVRMPGDALRAIEHFEPSCPAPVPGG
ncbi:hypothetical protein ACWGCW_33145 [Streptomyces sp. NPDC054933]